MDEHPARSASLTGWYQQACGLLALGITVPAIRLALGAVGAGVWFSFQAVLVFLSAADFGISQAVSRQIAHLRQRDLQSSQRHDSDFINLPGGWAGISSVYFASRRLFGRVAWVVIVLLVVIHEAIFPFGALQPLRTVTSTLAWYLLGVATLLNLFVRPYNATLEGTGRLYVSNLILGSCQLMLASTLFVLAPVCHNMATLALCSVLWAGVQYWVYRRAFSSMAQVASDVGVSRPVIRALWRVASPLGQVSLASLMVSSIQVPLLGFFLGPLRVTGFYLAQKLSQAVTLAAMQITISQLPLFTQELGAGRTQQARHRLLRSILASNVLVTIGVLAFYFLSPILVSAVIGRQEYVSRALLGLLALDQLLLGWSVGWSRFVVASGVNPFLPTTMIGGLLNILLSLVFVHQFGVLGLGYAALLSGLCTHYWFNTWQGIRLLKRLDT